MISMLCDGPYMLRSRNAIEIAYDASRALLGAEAPFFCYFSFEPKEK